MPKFFEKIIAFTKTRYMKAMMDGFMGIAAITIAGSLFNLLKSIPIPAYQTFLTNSGLGALLSIPVSITSDLMAIYVVISMAYCLAKSFKRDGFAAGLIAFGSFMILNPLTASSTSVDPETGERVVTTVNKAISMSSVGSQGIFLAIIVGLLSARLYVFFLDRGWKIKMPDSVPPNVSAMFENMLPGGLTFAIFLVVRYLMSLTSYGTAQALIYGILQAPLMKIGGSFGGLLAYTVLIKVFWFFGIHGGMLVNSAMYPIISTVGAANLSAFAAGTPAPYPDWAYGHVVFASIGLLSLNILMLRAKSQRYKALAKVALPTSIFNITEPMMFGTPIVMNMILLVPFVASPVISILLTKLVMSIGLIAQPTGASGSLFIPSPISLSLLTADWKAFIWVLIVIVINMALYYPFFRVADNQALKEEQETVAAEQAASPEAVAAAK